MSNLYQLKQTTLYRLTKTTLDLAKQLAEQEGIKIEIESDYYIAEDDKIYQNYILPINKEIGDAEINFYPAIQPPQIYQILKAFEGVFGENPKYAKNSELAYKTYNMPIEQPHWNEWNKALAIGRIEGRIEFIPESYSRTLWQKWDDFENGAFHRGKEGMIEVLTELNDILKSKIK